MRIDETVRFLELGGVWKYQRNYHLISYRLSFNVLCEIADAKNLHSHFLFFFFFQKVERGFSIFQYAAIAKHSAKVCDPRKVLLNKAFLRLRQKSLVNEFQLF